MKTPSPKMHNTRAQEEALFDAAQRLTDPAQRKAFLDAACAQDPALRRRLDELFAAQHDAEQFFKEGLEDLLPASTETATQIAMPLSEKAGDQIGRYKLLE